MEIPKIKEKNIRFTDELRDLIDEYGSLNYYRGVNYTKEQAAGSYVFSTELQIKSIEERIEKLLQRQDTLNAISEL